MVHIPKKVFIWAYFLKKKKNNASFIMTTHEKNSNAFILQKKLYNKMPE